MDVLVQSQIAPTVSIYFLVKFWVRVVASKVPKDCKHRHDETPVRRPRVLVMLRNHYHRHIAYSGRCEEAGRYRLRALIVYPLILGQYDGLSAWKLPSFDIVQSIVTLDSRGLGWLRSLPVAYSGPSFPA